MQNRFLYRFTFIFFFLILSLVTIVADEGTKLNSGSDGILISGYDVVAYFTEGRAVKGDSRYTLEYSGITLHFASEENRALFAEEPERYLPQYGGYCAYGLVKNKLFRIEPDQFTIHKGKLYLNYNSSIRKRWLKRLDSYIKSADENWEKLGR